MKYTVKEDGLYITVHKEGKDVNMFISSKLISDLERLHKIDALEELLLIIKPEIKCLLEGKEPNFGMCRKEVDLRKLINDINEDN